jgi:hypothetical protein
MTTVFDPNGTPIPIYNRSGKAIVPMSINATGTDPNTQLTQVAEVTIFEIDHTNPTPGMGNHAFTLPANAEVGDECFVEVYGGYGADVEPFSGDSISSGQSASITSAAMGHFIKVDSNRWRKVSP